MELTAESAFAESQQRHADKLKNARRILTNWIMGEKQTIDRLLQDKVDDYIIVRELPLPVTIGEKTIYVGTFTLETQDVFFKEYATLLAAVGARHAGLELGVDFLKNGGSLYQILSTDKVIRRLIERLIQKTILKKQDFVDPATGKKYSLPKCSLGYFRKNVTIDGLMQICLIIYLYNFDATRRSLNILMGEMGAKTTSETFMWSWLRNLAGLSGNFLRSPLTSFVSPVLESQNETPPAKKPEAE